MICRFAVTRRWCVAGLIAAACAGGCDQLKGITESAPKALKSAVPTKKPEAPEPPKVVTPEVITSAKLNLGAAAAGAALETTGCFASLAPLGAGRPAVFQLTSYASESAETFPSVYFRAEVDAVSLSALVGQKVAGQFYLQREKEGVVWCSPPGQPVEISVTSANERALIAEIVDGQLAPSNGGLPVKLQGAFSATVQ